MDDFFYNRVRDDPSISLLCTKNKFAATLKFFVDVEYQFCTHIVRYKRRLDRWFSDPTPARMNRAMNSYNALQLLEGSIDRVYTTISCGRPKY